MNAARGAEPPGTPGIPGIPGTARTVAGVRATTWAGLAAAAIYAASVAGARPFTVPADVAVSIPSALFAVALVMQRLSPDAGPWRRMGAVRPAPGPAVEGGSGADSTARISAVPWVIVVVVLVGVELASYFHGGPRADYPTISSGLDALFGDRAAKFAGWFGWLVVGWYLARR